MRVTFVAEAERELIEGARFYADQSGNELGLAFIAEFERCVGLLRLQPKLGAQWRGANRRMPLRRFPYSVIYALLVDEVRILAIAHQRRKPGYWRDRH